MGENEKKTKEKNEKYGEKRHIIEKMSSISLLNKGSQFTQKTVLYTFIRNSFDKNVMDDVKKSLDQSLLRY